MKKFLLSYLLFTVIISSKAQTGIWGVTTAGGHYNAGAIFNTDGSGNNYTLKESFFRYDGDYPKAHLLQASNGKLYGMTASCCTFEAYGILFEYDPVTKIYDKKFDFNDTINGSNPDGALIQATDGKIYGMTSKGGINNRGVIFQYDPVTFIYKKVFDFDDIQGSTPEGSLLQATDGKLYGLTSTGGSHDYGVLFQFDPSSGTYVKKYDFDEVTSGGNPLGALIQSKNGKLYGLTSGGGKDGFGVLFEYDLLSSKFTKRFDFNGTTDGAYPFGSLIEATDGNMYGLASGQGAHGYGVLFQFNPVSFAYKVKVDFNENTSGSNPQSSLIQASDGKLYGNLQNGAAHEHGAIFQYDPVTSTYAKMVDFNDDDQFGGKYPISALMQAKDGNVYAMCYNGGISNAGILYKFNTATSSYTKEFDFHYGSQGTYPISAMVQGIDKKLYGITQFGGVKNEGTIFQYDPASGAYKKMADFDRQTTGGTPTGPLMKASDGKLYGTTSYGGIKDKGVLFQYDPATNSYAVKFGFDGLNGSNPVGELMEAKDGKIYGTTREGGLTDEGVLFQFDLVTAKYTKTYDFGSSPKDGKYPEGGLTQGDDGKLYGVTTIGGDTTEEIPDGFGVLFQYDPVTQKYSKKINFDGAINGSNPNGTLVKTADGKLFGMTTHGGSNTLKNPNGCGTIFQYDPVSSSILKRFNFDGTGSGSNPNGSLLLASNGNLYGVTNVGGAYNMGALFQFDPVNFNYLKKMDLKQVTGKYGEHTKLIEIPLVNAIAKNHESQLNMHVYPNPGAEFITLRLDQPVYKATIKLFTITGQLVTEKINMSGEHFSFNISGLSPGIYFAELNEDNAFLRMKFIKE